jgi:hypothetical protein
VIRSPEFPRRGASLRRFVLARGAVASVEFAICGLGVFFFIIALLNLGLLGFSMSDLARTIQSTARYAAVTAANSYANNSSYTCPSLGTVVTAYNSYTYGALPTLAVPSGTTSSGSQTNGNMTLTTAWTNSTGSAGSVGLYVTLTGTYTWKPVGWPGAFSGIPLKISTVATVTYSSGVATSCS